MKDWNNITIIQYTKYVISPCLLQTNNMSSSSHRHQYVHIKYYLKDISTSNRSDRYDQDFTMYVDYWGYCHHAGIYLSVTLLIPMSSRCMWLHAVYTSCRYNTQSWPILVVCRYNQLIICFLLSFNTEYKPLIELYMNHYLAWYHYNYTSAFVRLDNTVCYVTCLKTIFHPREGLIFFLEQP